MPLFTTSGGPLLRPEEVHELIIRPVERESVALQVCTVVRTSSRDYRLPVVVADASAGWVAEGADLPISDPTLAEVVVTPPKVGGVVVISRELADDSSPEASDAVGLGVTRKIIKALDDAFFTGLTAPAAPGLPSLVGVGAVAAGTTFTNLDAFATAISQAEQQGATLTSFVANPADALTLSKIKETSTSVRPLLGSDATDAGARRLLGVPLLVSPSVAAGVVWGIPRDRVVAVIRDDARIEADAGYYFLADRVAVRGTMRVGFGFPHPAAVQRIATGA